MTVEEWIDSQVARCRAEVRNLEEKIEGHSDQIILWKKERDEYICEERGLLRAKQKLEGKDEEVGISHVDVMR